MTTFIYVLTKTLTFPGALTKGFYEQLMCRIFKCPVEDNNYLSANEMCGHVEHELITGAKASYMFCFIPGLLNFLTAVFLGIFPMVNMFYLGNYQGFIASSPSLSKIITDSDIVLFVDRLLPLIFAWLVISMLTNIFPIMEDIMVVKESYGKLSKVLKVVFFPGYIVMRVGAVLERYGLSFVLLVALTAVLALA